MSEPPLKEPDLPRTAKVRPKALRTGFTTGACSAAAAKAAAALLVDGYLPATVDIPFPDDRYRRFEVDAAVVEESGRATAVVVKDAGDDPDVTHGARMTVTIAPREDDALVLHGGEGVGTVTQPGLGLEVGGPAINPVPREMITRAVREVLGGRGAEVTITVPGGERMSRKTTNRRLGIHGGISILGTTGIVRPFSTASWRSSVEQAVSVLAAQGGTTAVLSTGGRTEKAAMRLLPDEPDVAFIEVGDFTGAALRRAVEHGLDEVVFVGMIGKLTKLASGVVMTHYTRSKVDTELLGRLTAEFGGDAEQVAEVEQAKTARRAFEVWEHNGSLSGCAHRLCVLVAGVLERFTEECGRRLRASIAMVDFTGEQVVASTEARWVT
ncbi:cobalt-precorrin-5B (C(1))-methyltransferase [Haloactinomyces albus]|uniref:Cobalt-precorrin-5B C(1)-methyltransferase n=1 Tax=Haloactinomyces albus TaxID=1352928 RepID=A0AAE4CKS7_9ACTN|nr:cobalt-precorrin-5B (C(1))-methyltransferase [Haloactinomyces albus]MDR7300671.1 cobalt-precorrin-5B (C1)-methyltransferase [Haloactinomyces albus]